MMRITSKVPNTWKNLQVMVGQILEECGMTVEVEKKVASVRGTVEIDVYAEEEINGRTYSIICECKYWKNSIPQNVIHGLRTVLNDLGCNIGYVITTSKFQSGSIQAVEKTNLVLMTWESFQDAFFESWYAKHFYQIMNKALAMPFDYLIVPWFDDLSKEDKKKYNQIRNMLLLINEIESNFPMPFLKEYGVSYSDLPKLPLKGNMFESSDYEYIDLPDNLVSETSYQEFLAIFVSFGKKVISDFQELDEKYSKGDEV
jgi:restriction system protein